MTQKFYNNFIINLKKWKSKKSELVENVKLTTYKYLTYIIKFKKKRWSVLLVALNSFTRQNASPRHLETLANVHLLSTLCRVKKKKKIRRNHKEIKNPKKMQKKSPCCKYVSTWVACKRFRMRNESYFVCYTANFFFDSF